jgi:glycosyltransferase involved in cell wall biosynthesis
VKHLFFTVTNDLVFDQRMHRICTSVAAQGFRVTLVGRELKQSPPLQQKNFEQKRLRCFFNKGFLFYAEYNIRLFCFLLLKRMDGICAIDLDTILPCLLVSKIKGVKRIYDAHELFTEMKEVRSRKNVKRLWDAIEKFCVPRFENGYTVSDGLANEFKRRYGRDYLVIRNIPPLDKAAKPNEMPLSKKFILYQGAVNEGRGFEYLIPAMREVNHTLVICGDGNFMTQLKDLINVHKVNDKIVLKGMLPPKELQQITKEATAGINLVEKEGLNQYYSLANKFFDYIHAGVPQLSMNYPEYKKINDEFEIAVLIDELHPGEIAAALNKMMENDLLLKRLSENCIKGREELNWQNEEKKLIKFYHQAFRG